MSKLDPAVRWEREVDAEKVASARERHDATRGLEAWRVFQLHEAEAPEGAVNMVDQWAQFHRDRGFSVRVYKRHLRAQGFHLPVIVVVVTKKTEKSE